VTTKEAKARLAPYLSEGNRAKTMAAPATAIIGYDVDFARHVPKLFPHAPGAKDWFADPKFAEVAAFRNGSLQGAYFIVAARALGLDCGPMSGFDNAGVDREFFAGTAVKSNFLCSVGYGDPSGLFERSPRLAFDEACQIL
jgi:3-hydroxypropanoate dehydrogenase